MKLSNLIFLLGITVALIAAWFYYNKTDAPKNSLVIGNKLLPEFLVNDVAVIAISDSNSTLNLQKVNGVWCVNEYQNYYADFNKIFRLLKEFNDAVIGQIVNIDQQSFYKLELEKPSGLQGPGTLFTMKNANGITLAEVIVGKAKQSSNENNNNMYGYSMPDGYYVNIVGTDKAILVKNLFDVNCNSNNWIQKEVTSIPQNTIKEIEVISDENDPLVIKRATEAESLSLNNIPDDMQMEENAVRELAAAFERISVRDIFTLAQVADQFENNTVSLKYVTFEELVYNVKLVATTNHTILVKLNMNTDAIVTNEIVTEVKYLELKDRAKIFNEKFDNWCFEIYGRAEQFVKKPTDLLRPKDPVNEEPQAEIEPMIQDYTPGMDISETPQPETEVQPETEENTEDIPAAE